MVAKLIGTVNGQEIIFDHQGGDTWTCTFPASGTYETVVELKAFDEAGNFCYTAKYCLLLDLNALVVKLLPLNYWLTLLTDGDGLVCVEPVDFWSVHLNDETFLQCMEPCDYWLEYRRTE